MRGRRKLLIALAALAGAAALALAPRYMTDKGSATQALFAARMPDAEGRMQALSQWRGKTLVVNFWASWCPPCLEEMPELSALQNDYRARNVVVLGISSDDQARVGRFAHGTTVSYPLLAGDFEAMRLAELLGNTRAVLPYTVVIRSDGSLAMRYAGRIDINTLKQHLDASLPANQAVP